VQPDEHSDLTDRTRTDPADRGRKRNGPLSGPGSFPPWRRRNGSRADDPGPWDSHAFRVPWVLVAIPVGFIQLVGTAGAAYWGRADATPQNWFSKILILAGPVALLFARRYPRTVVGVAVAAAATYYSFGYAPGPVFLSVIVSLLLWGRTMRMQRNADRHRARVAEKEQRAGAERLRIAQELHDVLAHHISLINVQAGVALHLVDERPEQTRTALAAIKSASKEALGELRAALDALRNPGDEAPRAPTAGLSELPAIVDSVRAAGLDVDFAVEGEPRDMGVATELAALRIVQESLTNVIRHSGATAASVALAYEEGRLRVAVADNGTGGVPVPGNGLGGMRERATALGGTCTAGPAPGGGFVVKAELPG